MVDWNRIRNAVVWYLGAFLWQLVVTIALKGEDAIPSGDWRDWLVFLCVAAVAGAGKYTTSTKVLGLDRDNWTDTERQARQGLPPKRPERNDP